MQGRDRRMSAGLYFSHFIFTAESQIPFQNFCNSSFKFIDDFFPRDIMELEASIAEINAVIKVEFSRVFSL